MKAEVVRLGYYGHAVLGVNEFGGAEIVITSGDRALQFNLAVEEIEDLIDGLSNLAHASADSQTDKQRSSCLCDCDSKAGKAELRRRW